MLVFKLEMNNGMGEKVKAIQEASKEALILAVRMWHDNMLPKHFRHGAAVKYNYAQRQMKYQRHKQKKGSPPALVYTGRARDTLLNSVFVVTYSKDRAVGKFVVGNQIKYFWMTPSNQPNKPQEMKKTLPQESAQIGAFIADYVAKKANNPKAINKVVIS